MHHEEQNSVVNAPSQTPNHSETLEKSKPVSSETLKQIMMMAGSLDENNLPLNEGHVSEILSQRGRITEYIHDDRKRDFEKFKHESWDKKFFFALGAVVWLVVFVISIVFFKEQAVTILASTATFLGGYGLGSKDKIKE